MSKRKKRDSLVEFTSLSQKHLAKLTEQGYTEIPAVAAMNEHELRVLLDTTINKARSIIEQARLSLPQISILTLSDMAKEDQSRYVVSSGVKSIDDLLGGRGFESGVITEIAGEFGSGKSQIALSVCVRAAAEGNGVVVAVDTEGTWRRDRIMEIVGQLGLDPVTVQANFRLYKPIDSGVQSQIMKGLLEGEGTRVSGLLRIPPHQKVKLLVVDSLTGLFRIEYAGRGVLAERQQHLANYIKDLYVFARKCNCVVIVTNQVVHSPEMFVGMRAIGGNIVGHACTLRTMLKKKRGLLRSMEMVDAAHLPVSQALFVLTGSGIGQYTG